MVSVAKPRVENSRYKVYPNEAQAIRDGASQATEALIRRVLCSQSHGSLTEPQTPIHELLPPLTSSHAVDIHLYAIISVVMRDFVYSWYGKITSDHTFVEETIRIIAHCTKDLEQRLRQVDLEALLLNDIPSIIKVHIDAFRTAQSQGHIPDSAGPEKLYHALFPHPALSPAPEHGLSTVEQIKNEASYRQLLVQGVLAVILPTEDLRNPCLRSLVSDIIADMILGNGVGGKASAGWLMWDGIAKALEVNHTAPQVKTSETEIDGGSRDSSDSFISTTNLRRTRPSNPMVNTSRISTTIWRILQFIYMASLASRFVLVGLWSAYSDNSASKQKSKNSTHAPTYRTTPMRNQEEALSLSTSSTHPVLTFSIFSLLSQLLDLQNRLPWVVGCLSLIRHHLVYGLLQLDAAGGVLDTFLHNTIQQQLLRAELLPQILQIVRNGIFPNNALGPARPIPTPVEQRLIKRRAAQAILKQLPTLVADVYLRFDAANKVEKAISSHQGADADNSSASVTSPKDNNKNTHNIQVGGAKVTAAATQDELSICIPDPDTKREAQLAYIESILDLFGNQYMNKHMIYAIIELVIVRLVPELQTKSVKELLDERLGTT